jgi:hypothetical protein
MLNKNTRKKRQSIHVSDVQILFEVEYLHRQVVQIYGLEKSV